MGVFDIDDMKIIINKCCEDIQDHNEGLENRVIKSNEECLSQIKCSAEKILSIVKAIELHLSKIDEENKRKAKEKREVKP